MARTLRAIAKLQMKFEDHVQRCAAIRVEFISNFMDFRRRESRQKQNAAGLLQPPWVIESPRNAIFSPLFTAISDLAQNGAPMAADTRTARSREETKFMVVR